MTRLVNDPTNFPAELVDGFVEANSRYVRKVFGGVVRATQSRPGKVAIITGGGTGHYPGFVGWVGPGLVDGAVTGNIFSSPSASQAYSVAKAVEKGGGVFIAFLNYTGDVLHFGQAAERLRADGIAVRVGVVTDDIASAPIDDRARRRGIAGGLAVFKIVSAAAEEGASLDEIAELFAHANERVRTFGVAFSGCTLPGADHPLFEIPDGKIGVGLGVHGEPGIYETDLGTAADIAALLVDRLVQDRPENSGRRVVAVLNGLGSAKYEELFVTYHAVTQRIADAGLDLVDGEVGEFMTSLDMGGVSLTLIWLDQSIESRWFAPCDTAAFRRAPLTDPPLADSVEFSTEPETLRVVTPGSAASRAAAGRIAEGLDRARQTLEEHQAELGDLDAIAGDGDHGIGMTRGARAAAEAAAWLVANGAGVKTTLVGAGDRWSEQAGGASGALWGAALTAAGAELGDTEQLEPEAIVRAVRAFVDAIQRLGGARVGDKTMLCAQVPFADAFEAHVRAGEPLAQAWPAAAQAAAEAAQQTAELTPRIGRARVLAERSVGYPDPGAISFSLLAAAMTPGSLSRKPSS